MPCFYIKTRFPDGVCDTPEADEYPSLDAARQDALVGAKELVADALRRSGPLSVALDRAIEIVDERGQVAATISFREAAEADLRSKAKGTAMNP